MEHCLKIREQHLGAEHLEVGVTLCDLGHACPGAGSEASRAAFGDREPSRCLDAEAPGRFCQKARRVPEGKGVAGEQPQDHGASTWSRPPWKLHILSREYGDLEDYPKQKDLLEHSLEIKEKIYERDHPQAALILNPLGKGKIIESPTWPGH